VLIVPDSLRLAEYLALKMPVVRRFGAGQLEVGEEEDEFVDIILTLQRKCVLDRHHAHKANQDIIIAHGIVPILFEVLDHDDQPCKAISACFQLFDALAKDNEYVQTEFYERVDRVLTLNTKVTGWENDLARAMATVFADNQVLSLRLSQSQIELMMEIVKRLTVNSTEMLRTLISITKCEELGVPLPRNQHLIMKMLMRSFDEVVGIAHIEVQSTDDQNRKRLALLRGASGAADEQLRRYHASLVGLFATCAEGMNRFIESTCMTLLDLHEILEVLLDQEIPAYVKTEYMRFFNYVYIETEGSKEEMGTSELYHDQRLWQAIRGMAQQELPRMYGDNAPYLKLDDELFIYEGFFPFVTDVLRSVYIGDQYPESVRVVQGVGQLVSQFAQRALGRLHDHEHVKALCTLMAQLDLARRGSIAPEIKTRVADRLRARQAGLAQPSNVRDYQSTYNQQDQLNNQLNEFAMRMRHAYRGENTVQVQLPDAKASGEVAERQYCEGEDEDEPLPLGPEFQAFLALFVVYDRSKTPRCTKQLRGDIKSLVRALEISHKYHDSITARDQERQERLDMRCLQLLRAVLHNEIKLGNEDSLEDLQDKLADTKAILPVASMLSMADDNVVREALALLVTMLLDGNKKAQTSFEEHFLDTREETFFDDIVRRIQRSIDSKRELRALRSQVERERAEEASVMGTMTLATNLGAMVGEELDGFGDAQETDAGVPLQIMGGGGAAAAAQAAAAAAAEDNGKIDLGITDEGNIELVLRVLQYMCEGHNSELQNYLRYQPDNIRTIDLVSKTVAFFTTLMDEINDATIELVIQTVDTLVEFSQGCQDNQKTIFDAKAVDSINFILRFPHMEAACGNTPENDEKVAHLKLSCATLILAMLENSGPATHRMADEIQDTLDLESVIRTMHYYVKQDKADVVWQTDADNDDDPVEAGSVAYAFYNILVRLQDFTNVDYARDKVNPFRERVGDSKSQDFADPVMMEMAKTASSIEIMRDGEVHKIHFQDKWSKKIREDVKEALKWGVDRGSPSDQLADFVKQCKTIMADIAYFDRVMDASPITKLLLERTALWRDVLLFLTFIINILMLAVWEAPLSFDKVRPNFSVDWYSGALYALGGLHIFVSVLVSAAYFLLRPPSAAAVLDHLPKNVADRAKSWLPWLDDDSARTKTSPFSTLSLHHIFLVLFSVLGIFFDGYFYCYHLLHVVVGNDLLVRVMSSVTKNGKSLLWVAALMVIIIYIYSLASFAYLRKNFDAEEGAFCDTAFQCFITSLRLGLLSGGGLGEALPPESFSFSEPGYRTFFDLSYFIIITIIGLNVVFGIIVDTFSELRDERYQIQEAMVGECFICA
jgi:inositol 1,4,5-triphosphate receptor type 1